MFRFPIFETIISDPCREIHKITNQQIMVHIESLRGKMYVFSVFFVGPLKVNVKK